MAGGELRHCMKLGLSRLTKSLRVDDESVLAIKVPAHDLKKQDLECIEKLAILGQGKTGIFAMEIEDTALIGPLRRHLELKTDVANDLR